MLLPDTLSVDPDASEVSEAEPVSPKGRTYRVAFLITIPVFMAYACCFSLQRDLMRVFELSEGVADERSTVFGIGVSFVYFFNLIFRVVGHNVVFGFLGPRNRVIAALVSSIVGMGILSVLSFQKPSRDISMGWVFVANGFVGVCEGSFGPNMLTIVNQLGETRLYVVMAMPFGISLVTIGSFGLMALGVPYQFFYIFTACMLGVAIVLYIFTIYRYSANQTSNFDLRVFWGELKRIREWFPKIWVQSLIFVIDMFCLGLFNPGITLFMYESRVTYRLFGFTVDRNWFVFVYNVGGFLGDFLARRVMDKRKILNPVWFLVMLVIAVTINLCLVPEVSVVASFFFMWANGSLYCQTTKKIGEEFVDEFHLTATSVWLFIGDAGSTTGSNFIQLLRPAVASLKKRMF